MVYCENIIDLSSVREDKEKYNTKLQMDEIMKKLFMLHNKKPIIDFLNAIYEDNISYDAVINYGNREFNNINLQDKVFDKYYCDMHLNVIDEEKIYNYQIEFQTVHDKKMAIRLFRYGFEKAVEQADFFDISKEIEITLPEPYLIVLEESNNVPDRVKLIIKIPKQQSIAYESKVLKYWKYDIDMLYNDNMYLLYPLQIFKYRKRMKKVHKSNMRLNDKKTTMEIVYNEVKTLVGKTVAALEKAYEEGKIDINDYEIMAVIIENLINYFNSLYGKYRDIEEEVSSMLKTLYDHEVEKRGIEKGIQKGEHKKAIVIARKMILRGDNVEDVVEMTELSKAEVLRLKNEIELKKN